MTDTLESRVQQFSMLELPGQPQGMHMGTSYLVSDLWNEVQKLKAGIERLNAERAGDQQRLFHYERFVEPAKFPHAVLLVNATIERCAQYHDKAAKDCDDLAAIKPDLAADYTTRAMDHRIDAANIRKLKDSPTDVMGAWDDRYTGSAKEIEAHTIERCAQVAENFIINWDNIANYHLQVAAAIRKLKDTPNDS